MLKESGFAYAKVRTTARVDLNARAADITAEMQLGKRAHFGAIRVSGLQQIPESKVRAALRLKPGAQYSEAELLDAQGALEEMQVFTRVQVTPDLSSPASALSRRRTSSSWSSSAPSPPAGPNPSPAGSPAARRPRPDRHQRRGPT